MTRLRIDIFMPHHSRYNVLHYFSEKLYEALNRQGANCRLLAADLDDPGAFLKALSDDRPDFTLTMNGMPLVSDGQFFCDIIKIPHVSYLVDAAWHFPYLAKSERSIIASVDRTSADFFKNALFLPHGVDSSLEIGDSKREYDVVSLASCIDYEAIRKTWKKKFGVALTKKMNEAAEIALEDYLKPFPKIFHEMLGDNLEAWRDVEMVVRGKDRMEMLKAVKDAKVDIFGFDDAGVWKKYLGKKRNMIIHDAVPFEQAIEIMKRSKIVLNSCAWIKYGSHERILTALACGAMVITDENAYMLDHFNFLPFYQPGRWDKINDKVCEYLSDEGKREKVATRGRELVMNSHTWDKRAYFLLDNLAKYF